MPRHVSFHVSFQDPRFCLCFCLSDVLFLQVPVSEIRFCFCLRFCLFTIRTHDRFILTIPKRSNFTFGPVGYFGPALSRLDNHNTPFQVQTVRSSGVFKHPLVLPLLYQGSLEVPRVYLVDTLPSLKEVATFGFRRRLLRNFSSTFSHQVSDS